MHQLTKDPAYLLAKSPIQTTESSPVRTLSRHQLMRYLDYCSELLALNAKVAALFAQNTDDTAVLNAVNDLELLTQGLSAKIWSVATASSGPMPAGSPQVSAMGAGGRVMGAQSALGPAIQPDRCQHFQPFFD